MALACWGAASLLCKNSALAGTATWDFTTDPTTGANALQIYQTGFANTNGQSVYWLPSGGDPGGFLGLTWSLGSSSSVILFPDIDGGKLVTAFQFDADLRVGNPQEDVRAADGFSINFARSNDPVWQSHSTSDMAMSGQPEDGTSTGIAIAFDTWSGNSLPDGNDIEGIIVRVDNKTVLEHGEPTRNGACADATSMQTGPRNLDYWTAAKAATLPDGSSAWPSGAFMPDAWSNLCWQHLTVTLDTNSQLTVIWKGTTILDHAQTDFFPSAGGIILAGRTGGADEMCHLDNMKLTTTATAADTTPPTTPTGLRVVGAAGASRVELSWNPSTDNSGRVAYEVSRDGTVLTSTLVGTNYVDFAPKAGATVNYSIRALDVSLNYSTPATLAVTTAADVQVPGTVKCEIYTGLSGTTIGDLLGAASFPNNPNTASYTLGLSAGNPNGTGGWNNSFGDSYGMRMTGILTPTVSGSYDFFIRSDDGSGFWLNMTGNTPPDPNANQPLVQEASCCHAFLEFDDANNNGQTVTNIALTAGTQYGFTCILKEGGGGDGVAVGMRIAGDKTAAANVPAIGGLQVTGGGDAVGSILTFLTQPASVSTVANEKASFSATVTNFSYYDKKIWPSTSWYQWTKNGAPVAGANSSAYTIPVVALSDNNAQIAAIVGSEGLVRTSSVVTLTVAADNKPPTIASAAQTDSTFTSVAVTFSEPVTAPTATTAGNYTLSSGATVSSAALSTDGFTVTLTTSALTPSTAYTLTVNNVKDNAGNTIAASSQVQVKAWVHVLSTVKCDVFGNISGTTVDLLQADPRFPNTPDSSFNSTNGLQIGNPASLTGWNDSYGDNYGMRITGTLSPPGTGAWDFFIRSDDSSAFYLNTTGPSLPNDYPTNAPVCYEPGCCNGFLEPSPNTYQTSTNPITLTAGQQYGFVVLLKEGGGGDGVAVGMRLHGVTTPTALNVPPIATYMPQASAPPPSGTTIIVSHSGNNVTLSWTGGGTLQSAPQLLSTGTQWADIPAASSPYTTGATNKAAYYRVKQ
jgi:hypothetical protein